MSEEIDKHVLRKYEIVSKLGKGVSASSLISREARSHAPVAVTLLSWSCRTEAWQPSYLVSTGKALSTTTMRD